MTTFTQTRRLAVRLFLCKGLMFLVIGLFACCLPQHAAAQISSDETHAATIQSNAFGSSVDDPEPLFGYSIYQVLGNRTRMIQVATIFMVVGIFFLLWGKTK